MTGNGREWPVRHVYTQRLTVIVIIRRRGCIVHVIAGMIRVVSGCRWGGE